MSVAPRPPVAVAAPDPFADRHGLTFEANIGVGFAFAAGGDGTATSSAALAGLDLGLGGWLTPRLALTFRISGVDIGGTPTTEVDAFGGPALQYWADPHFWVGGGLGLAVLAAENCDGCVETTFGGDLRAGYSFGDGPSRFDISAELTPAPFHGAFVTGVALLIGYQHL